MVVKTIDLSLGETAFLSSLLDGSEGEMSHESYCQLKVIIERAVSSRQITENELIGVFTLIESERERLKEQLEDCSDAQSRRRHSFLMERNSIPDNMDNVRLEYYLYHKRALLFRMSLQKGALQYSKHSQHKITKGR